MVYPAMLAEHKERLERNLSELKQSPVSMAVDLAEQILGEVDKRS